jgi:hypothetical protein
MLPGEVAWRSMLRTPRAKDFTGQGNGHKRAQSAKRRVQLDDGEVSHFAPKCFCTTFCTPDKFTKAPGVTTLTP